jgi:hypothetical protein
MSLKHLHLDLYWHWRRFAEPFYAWKRSFGSKEDDLRTCLGIGPYQLNRVFTAVTHTCNARCKFCAYPILQPAQEVMAIDMFIEYAAQWARMGGKRINLTPTFGDPLLDPDICQKIKSAKILGLKVALTTNAIRLLNSGIQMTGIDYLDVSVPSWDKDEYTRVYGVSRLPEVVEGLYHFQKTRRQDQRLLIHFRHACKPSLLVGHPIFKSIRKVNPVNFGHHFTYGFDNWMGQVELPEGQWVRQVNFKAQPCRWAFALTLEPSGAIRVCGCRYDKHFSSDMIVGQLDGHTGLREAWDNAQGLISDFYAGKRRPTCESCTFYEAARKDTIA